MGFSGSTEVSDECARLLIWQHKNTSEWREQGYSKTMPLNVRAFHRF